MKMYGGGLRNGRFIKRIKTNLIFILVICFYSASAFAQGIGAAEQEDAEGTFTLQEIVVTSQKRTEKLQEVTASASVLPEETLLNSNAANITDLNNLVPSLQLKGSLNGRVPMAMRGISTNALEGTIGLTSGVSIMVDGVPVPSDSMGVNELEDIQRVEVLKGPQSTLGGRTASAGVINIVTRAPSDHLNGSASIMATTDKEKSVQGFLSGPLSDKVGFSLSGNANDREYPIKNINGGKHSNSSSKGARAKLAFQPNDDLSFTLTGHYLKYDSQGADLIYQYISPDIRLFPFIPYPPDQPMPPTSFGIPESEAFQGLDIHYGNMNYNSPVKNAGADITDKDISLNVDYDLGRMVLSSITAYQDEDRKNIQDVPVAAVYFFDLLTGGMAPHFDNTQTLQTDVESLTQELKVTSPADDPVNFVAGLFYSDVDVALNGKSDWAANPSDSDTETATKTYAAYARVNWSLGSNTELITGLRYNRDELSCSIIQRASASQPPGVVYASPLAEDTSSVWVGDITVQQNLSENRMLYLTYARGYKPKVYNSSIRLTSNDPIKDPVEQEKIDHFELGSKGVYLKGRLIVNASLFDTVYKNFQVQVWNTSEYIPMLELKSAGEAETRGIELDLSAIPTQDLKINFSAAYIDAKFNKFENADNYPTQTAEEGATIYGQDLSGKQMPDSPKFKATLGVEQRILPKAIPFPIILGAQYSYRTEALMQANQNPKTKQPAFGILNLNIKAMSWSEKYSVTLFVNNVFDKFYLSNAEDFFSGIYGPSANTVIGYPARDSRRYAGLRFNVKF